MNDEMNVASPNGPEPEAAPEAGGSAGAIASEAGRDGERGAEEVRGAEELSKELEAIKAQTAEYLEGWQRARADFANFRRRVEKEQSETYQNATARVITRFLDVYDDFDRALQEQPDFSDPEAVARWTAGIALIRRKLQNILDAEGVQRLDAAGEVFDPQRHEAVTHEESAEHEPGQVIGVVRPGYRIGDRIIRPAMVRVAR